VHVAAILHFLAEYSRSAHAQLLDRPQQALASLDIQLPPTQAVFVVESTPQQNFLVIPMMTDREVEILQSGLNSGRALRATRSRIILKAWQNADYKAQLLTDPKAILVAEGFQIPDVATVRVLENDPAHLYLVIPTFH
jgi:hypothetical protein